MRAYVEAIECGQTQACKHVGVIPLICRKQAPIAHLVLREALEKGLLANSEVSEGGHVPELTIYSMGPGALTTRVIPPGPGYSFA